MTDWSGTPRALATSFAIESSQKERAATGHSRTPPGRLSLIKILWARHKTAVDLLRGRHEVEVIANTLPQNLPLIAHVDADHKRTLAGDCGKRSEGFLVEHSLAGWAQLLDDRRLSRVRNRVAAIQGVVADVCL